MKGNWNVSVIGSGIIGLAHALAFAKRGYKVNVFERNNSPLGASIRNFGMFWTLGHEQQWLPLISKSREIWREVILEARIPSIDHGALILAYWPEELSVLKEFYQKESDIRGGLSLFNKKDISKLHLFANPEGLLGGLRSINEFVVNPRTALPKIIDLLSKKYQVKFYFNTSIDFVGNSFLASEDRSWNADIIVICCGSEFETLFPQKIREACLEKCHLQMMKATASVYMQLGAVFCSGLSLIHYPSFWGYDSCDQLKRRYEFEFGSLMEKGINVMAAQNADGSLMIGDSHKYDLQPQPFIREDINNHIISYLRRFLNLPEFEITERWTGTYAVHPAHKHFFEMVDKAVWISTGFGGGGITLGFGQAEENVSKILSEKGKHGTKYNQPVAY